MSRKALVLDANILVRAVLGNNARSIVYDYYERVDFFAPAQCFAEAREHLPAVLGKYGIPVEPAMEALDRLQEIVQPLDADLLGEFETRARARLAKRDPEDWPILAASMAIDCPIWTEDQDFFGVGVATLTTANVRDHLDN